MACTKNKPCLIFLSKTKCERSSKLQCLSNLGFDNTACVPSVGQSCGLFATWRSNWISVDIISQGRQLFHFHCKFPSGCDFFVTAVYSILDYHHKQLFWSELRGYVSSMREPWNVIGDFNDIASSRERTGGMGRHVTRCSVFSDRIRYCNLFDLGVVGSKFTWRGPKLAGGRRLFKRLNRVIANEEFISHFSECSVQVMARTRLSDHNPLCLKCVNCFIPRGNDRPFRFEAMWICHDNVDDFFM